MLEIPESLGLYIHIPWCIKKCPYCDFNSHQSESSNLPEQQYLEALITDFSSEISALDMPRTVSSVFIGGGTPSLLSPEFYAALFAELRSHIDFKIDAEITMEANPGAVEAGHFSGFREVGINRLSIGVQSFSDKALNALGRIHNATDAKRAFSSARIAGFDNINIDLMHGLPGQTLQAGLDDIQQAIALKPEHISWYQLTIEKNTEFYKRPPKLPVEDALHDIATQGGLLLLKNNYQQYEISAYALKGIKQSEHNKNYWLFGDYLGIGAGAHSKLSKNEKVMRHWKTRGPTDYMRANNQRSGQRIIAPDELPVEFMMNALRLNDGFEKSLFTRRTGLKLSMLENKLQQLQDDGMLEIDGKRVRPSARGRQFLDDLVAQFIA